MARRPARDEDRRNLRGVPRDDRRREPCPWRPSCRCRGPRHAGPRLSDSSAHASAHGRAFYGTRSLDLIVIARVFVCVILVAVLAGVVLFALFRMGILQNPQQVSVVVLVATIVLSALVTQLVLSLMLRRLLKPVRALREAMERVAQGDFSARVDDEGADSELGALLRGFNTMAEELGSVETLRDEFVDDFSHELKTPMTSIRGFARQIGRDASASPATREYAGIIESEADRLVSMSSNVLALSRFESQHVVADPRPFSLDEQLRRCVLVLQASWEARGVEMDLDLRPVRALGGEDMLSQVWINLLDNAVKYGPAGGTVHVRCWRDDEAGLACASVRDEGTGMDRETLARAFDKFYRGPQTAASTSGNGLGLPIVRRVVELSGGRVSVRTEPGHGTEVTVSLPAAAPR